MNLMDMSIKVSADNADKIKQFLSQLNVPVEPQEIVQNEVDLSEDEIDLLSDDHDVSPEEQAYIPQFFASNSEPNKDLFFPVVPKTTRSEESLESQYHQSNKNRSVNNYDFSQMYMQQEQNVVQEPEDEKITLNVGGKKFNIRGDWLEHLNINCSRLHKIDVNGKTTYFMDRDPYYFSKIIELVRSTEMDNSALQKNLAEYSEQLVSELCFYKLLDNKYRPAPKIKLKRIVGFVDSSQHNNVVKIIIKGQFFETFESTLMKGTYFADKLRQTKNNKLKMNGDPKLFRHILNLLRSGNLYVYSNTIMEMLSEYGIEYDVIVEKKIDYDIVPCHTKSDLHVGHMLKSTVQYVKDKYPHATDSVYVDGIAVVTTESEMNFDSKIIFNLNDCEKYHLVNNMFVCVDIPVINPTESCEYIDFLEYRLIESASVHYYDQKTSKTTFLISTIPDYLYLYPELYTNNSNEHHDAIKFTTKKLKLIYNNNLIDIHRIMIPLFLFESSPLPTKKMITNGILTQLSIQMPPLQKIFKDKIKNISLLNISLIIMHKNKMFESNVPEKSALHMYERLHALNVQVQPTNHPIYDVGIVSLEGIGMIKDFALTIITKENNIRNTVNVFSENLIELEIISASTNTPFCILDASLMNSIVPLKKLGHMLPPGIYYNSFSADPRVHKYLGGIHGGDVVLRFKVKKASETIRLYVNEYHEVVF